MPQFKYTTKVAVVDDHPIFRHGVAQLIEKETDMEVCAELDGTEDIIDVVSKMEPDVLILDIALGNADGIVVTRELRSKGYQTPIIILSMHESRVYVSRAFRAGVNGYVAKSESTSFLVNAIREVRQGRLFVNGKENGDVLKSLSAQYGKGVTIPLDDLSDRERQIFELIGRGHSTAEIAGIIAIRPKTVETYKGRIKEKLALDNASRLSMAAVEWATTEKLTASAVI